MGPRRDARAGTGGGERISTLRPARAARLATAGTALVLIAALGAIVAGDAGRSTTLAWTGAGLAALLLVYGLAAKSTAPVQCGVAVLGAILLLRQTDRLLLAPLYGAGLLLVAELGARSIELSAVSRVDARAIATRLGALTAVAALGACAAVCAAIAVTTGPGRSLVLTAAGALAVGGVCAGLALVARRG